MIKSLFTQSMRLEVQLVYKLPCFLLILTLISGCNFPSDQNLPTPLPSDYLPTAVALTVEAQRTISAPLDPPAVDTMAVQAISQSEAENTPTPTSSPTPTPTTGALTQKTPTPPLPTSIPPPEVPYADIQILSPGPASRVSSPFMLKAYILPEENGRVQVELLGEDGRVLMREVKIYNPPSGARVTTGIEVTYEITAVAEVGRIQVMVVDGHGRTSSVNSIDLILLSMGETDLNLAGDNFEAIVIEEPKPHALIQGGTMRVSGLARLRGERPLMIELQTNEGKVVGSRQVAVESSDTGQYGNFAIDVPYNISAPTPVRLMVWERSDHIPGIVHLSSLEVLLSP